MAFMYLVREWPMLDEMVVKLILKSINAQISGIDPAGRLLRTLTHTLTYRCKHVHMHMRKHTHTHTDIASPGYTSLRPHR